MFHATRRALCKTSYMHFVNHRIGKLTAQVPIASPIKIIINDNALGRPNDSVIAEKKMPGEGENTGLSIEHWNRIAAPSRDQTDRLLESDKAAPPQYLARTCSRYPPAILLWRKSNHFRRLWIIRMVVQQNPHRSSRTTKDKKLHAHVVH